MMDSRTLPSEATTASAPARPGRYAWALALLLVLVAAYGLRSVGRDWDAANPGLHPDERFLSSVLYSIQFPATWGQYFDTATSPLNPENRGFGFFVYGTLPLFLIRAVYEVWNAVQPPAPSFYVLGRALSTLVDVGTVLLVYAVGRRLYGRGPGLLAAAAYALAVMPIQQSHYLTFDNYVTFFTFAALAVALRVQSRPWDRATWADDALFGLAVGLAMASKVSAAPAAGLLVLAHGLRMARTPRAHRAARLEEALYGLLLAAAVAFVTFRVWQPYAFRGPHIWDILPNPNWIANLQALKVQASGEADFPPAMQWARRPWWYGLANLVRWGLGWPLGLSALAGLVGLALRVARRPLRRDTLLVMWAAGYLAWQSSLWNPTMRYFLPAYPALAVLAAWVWHRAVRRARRPARRRVLLVAAAGVWLATAAWAWGFTRIYTRPHTRIAASRWFFDTFPAALTVEIRTDDGRVVWEPVPYPADHLLTPDAAWQAPWRPRHAGRVQAVLLYRLRPAPDATEGTLTVAVEDAAQQTQATARTALVPNDPATALPQPLRLALDTPLPVHPQAVYTLTLTVDRGAVTLEGTRVLNETTWDDGLPLRVDGYDPFGGLYTGLPALEMYWDDNEEKRQRFYDLLDQADVVFITSSRQWGSLPRLPERFPLVTAYYSHLMGCPPTEAIEPCYNRAQVGMFQGRLGFELVAVFESDPTIGPWRINDQPADEAFTVYDHPKVFVFRKRPDYDPARVRDLLGAVDLSTVVHVLPGRARSYPENLLLPPHLWARQTLGGTWRQLFPPEGLLNRYTGLAVVAWYALGGLLALLALPALRWPFGALPDRGWPVARLAGMLLWAWLAWWAGDAGIPLGRGLLWALLAGGALAAGVAYARAWADWRAWLRRAWPSLLRVELLYLAFFALDLGIRYLNPDLWHPWKGGEKPMDFAYFNAVLKSTVVPPYDPWFAKGFINYYYWGFALVGMPVKALGIRPGVAYNLILPTLFAGVATAAFALARGLAAAWHQGRRYATQAGLAAAVGTVLLGNLGTVRMLWEGLVRLGQGGLPLSPDLGLLERLPLAVEGFLRLLAGDSLPYIPGDWYWFPSRIIPAPGSIEPITEFPYFTFLYADLHAHMIALGVTLMALLWGWAVVRAARRGAWSGERLRGWAGWRRVAAALFWGGLIVGALRAINTWDYPTYLLLSGLALAYAWVVARGRPRTPRAWAVRLAEAGLGVLALYALTVALWRPYLRWYAQGYAQVTLWWGPNTPLSAYFWHWGLFYFVTLTWLGVLVVDWLRTVPAVEGLRWWRRGGRWAVLAGALVALGGPALVQGLYRTPIGWVTLPPLVLITALLLRRDLDDATRFGLTLWAAALSLTLMVEIIVLVGDLERMNTVFKFYLQAWVLWAAAAALGLVQVLRALPRWPLRAQTLWTTGLTALALGAFLFTWMATLDKVRDRMAPDAPHTLDGQAYMTYAQYFAPTGMLDLSEDYRAIRWLLTHVDGSPVIVEANTVEYQWGNRMAINTGLPAVVGWNWHQRQQRGVIVPGDWVTNRIAEVAGFYTTTERAYVEDFLRRYDVTYIVVGQLERATYPGPGLEKFRLWDGDLWQEVYRDGATVIYRVRR